MVVVLAMYKPFSELWFKEAYKLWLLETGFLRREYMDAVGRWNAWRLHYLKLCNRPCVRLKTSQHCTLPLAEGAFSKQRPPDFVHRYVPRVVVMRIYAYIYTCKYIYILFMYTYTHVLVSGPPCFANPTKRRRAHRVLGEASVTCRLDQTQKVDVTT